MHAQTARAARAIARVVPAGALLGLVLWVLPAPQPAVAAGAAGQARRQSTRDLGNRLCAPYGAYCTKTWRRGMAANAPFNRLIADVCLHVQLRETEDAGIACAETAIRDIHTLPVTVISHRQFRPGEREQHPFWYDKSDALWAQAAVVFFEGIPRYCDNATPEIYEYLPCLLRRMHTFQITLKKNRHFWPTPESF